MSNVDITLHIIEAIFPSILQNDQLMKTLLPMIFNLAYLVPLALPESTTDVETISKGLWESWLNSTCEMKRRDIIQEVVHNLGEFMMDSKVYPLYVDLK